MPASLIILQIQMPPKDFEFAFAQNTFAESQPKKTIT